MILSSDDEMETETRTAVTKQEPVRQDNVKSFPLFQPPVPKSVEKKSKPAPSTFSETFTESDVATYGFNAPSDACQLLKERFGYRQV